MARELGELQGVLKQLETYLGTWSQVGDAIAELLAQRAMVEQMPNAQKQLLKVNGDLDRLESQRRTIEGVRKGGFMPRNIHLAAAWRKGEGFFLSSPGLSR